MRLSRLLLPLALAASLTAGVACLGGGGDSSGDAPDLEKIPTATLPAQLPEVRVLGQSLVSTGGRRTYTIQPGDTFSGIATQLGITLEELIAANPDIDPTSLVGGDVINLPETVTSAPPATPEPGVEESPIPDPAEPEATVEVPVEVPTEPPPPPTEPPPAPPETPTPQSLGTTYVVQAGDSFASIAAQFGITIESLAAANPGVDSNNLSVGQVLMLPQPGG